MVRVEESPTARSGGRLFCYHVSSQTNVNLRKGRGRESERERGSDGVDWSGGVCKGEERRRRRRRVLDSSAAAAAVAVPAP